MLTKAQDGMKKALHHLENEFSKLQLGRANPAIVEDILVEQYGALQPLKNCSSVNMLDSQTLSIQPWDRSIIQKIAKAITEANLGLNPQSMADSVMIKFPVMTEDRRRDTVKIAKNMAEEAKVSIRNARQDSLKDIKKGKDEKTLSEDEVKAYEKDLQKLVDDANEKVEEMFKKKEIDIMKI